VAAVHDLSGSRTLAKGASAPPPARPLRALALATELGNAQRWVPAGASPDDGEVLMALREDDRRTTYMRDLVGEVKRLHRLTEEYD
jgi:hypothetical protein